MYKPKSQQYLDEGHFHNVQDVTQLLYRLRRHDISHKNNDWFRGQISKKTGKIWGFEQHH